MTARRIIKPPAATGAEKIREFEQRIKQLETKQSVRIGEHVLTEVDGRPVLIKPGAQLDVGTTPAEVIDLASVRGFVTDSQVAQAVSGGKTNSLSSATGVQVQKDVATANAQYVADNANAKAAELEARLNAGDTGYFFNDSFDGDYSVEKNLGPDYVRTTEGAGGGDYLSNGTGVAGQTALGGPFTQTWTDRHVNPTFTNSQTVSSTLNGVPNGSGGSGTYNARHTLIAQGNEAFTDRVELQVERNLLMLGYKLNNVWTEIARRDIGMADGDRFDLLVIAAQRRFVPLRNGLTVGMEWEDIGAVYPMDANHRFGGMANMAGTIVFNFWFTTQTLAPMVQSFNFADKNI
ncbi:hypothetical protein H7K45_27680 [Mycobacterium yunnanensis]|uniref:Uncharacterized protein n=1 Tax=Mycobacterium yunnanensis TaxID=368477 RepID=A0A9X2YRW8_9MYCO|nr:hypothetical protein [Mycobacterium yunnanensis]MCV7424333.1 hypothetical protein [Mycobacterium yunnanensis]